MRASRVDIGEIRRTGIAGDRDAVDLHRGVPRPQSAVGDEAGQGARAHRRTELRHLLQPRRSRDRAVHQDRARRPRRLGVQVVAQHDVRNTLAGKRIGQASRRAPGRQQPLHRIQRADRLRRRQRNGVADSPRAVAEHLQRLVVAGAPHLGGERRARDHQNAPRRRCSRLVLAEPVGGLMPILRYRAERARRGEPARPSQRGADHQRDQHDDSGRHPPVALGVGERTQPHLHRPATGKRYPAEHLRQAEHQRDPDHRSQLVHVAQRCAAGVQERLYLVGQRRAQPAAVAGGQQDHPDQQHRHQPSPRRHARGWPGRPVRPPRPGRCPGWRPIR